ncbi:Endoribonuclease Dicer1, partial [Caligus rogercresseyi]
IVNSTTHVIITETLSKRHNNTNSPAIEEIHDDDEETAEGESNKKEEDLTSLSDRLMNKMNEEDNKLKQKQLEIGTWSNELMEGVVNGGRSRRRPFIKFQDEFDEEDLELLLDPNMALPDNLTLLNNELLPRVDHEASKGGSKDWGTGIEQKIFRVGSPTFFSNPNIHIPGMMDEDDDLDGLSCSDSEDDDYYYEKFDTYRNRKSTASGTALDSVTQDGSGRIEFRGENMAEAIEDETEENLRVESLARNLEEEAKMLSEVPWDEIEGGGEEEDPGREKSLVEPLELNVLVLKENESFNRYESFPEKSPGSEYPRLEVGESESVDEESLVESFKNEFGINAMDRLEPIEFPQKTEEEEDVVYGVLPRDSDKKMEFHFDEQPELSSHPGPSPSIILQGLTMSNSNDAINLERLETIGDSFLKYAITSYLFKAYDSVHEGRLSHLRSKQVSNLHLFKLGRKKRLGECMIATKFEPHDNWLPPSYHVPPELEQALIESGVPANLWNMAEFPSADFGRMTTKEIVELIQEKSLRLARPKDSSVQDLPSFVPYNLLTQHSIPDKSIADCVEALIGAYLISCGQRGALLFMTWLGLKKDEGGSSKASCSSVSIGRELSFFLSGYEEFEDLIGYKFRDRALLLQSFSHASYYPNRITDCYQRLEFLGDAILDYLITRHLYEDPRMHSPGALTDLRSALVNNTIFAFLAVKFQFHKYFKHFSPGLATVIDRFVKLQVQNEYKVFDEFYLIEDEDEALPIVGDIEVPKALGDIFESVAGAIFLDSGQSLDAVWAIYYRMMRSEIEQFSSNVPKSPIRELLELEPETAKFGKPEKLADGKRVRVSVEVFGKGTYKGIGRNYRIAKCTAAKCALRALKKQGPDKSLCKRLRIKVSRL